MWFLPNHWQMRKFWRPGTRWMTWFDCACWHLRCCRHLWEDTELVRDMISALRNVIRSANSWHFDNSWWPHILSCWKWVWGIAYADGTESWSTVVDSVAGYFGKFKYSRRFQWYVSQSSCSCGVSTLADHMDFFKISIYRWTKHRLNDWRL